LDIIEYKEKVSNKKNEGLKMTKIVTLNTIKDIKMLEVPTGVSEKYVPILTSKIIETLAPEFTFKLGVKFGKDSKHYVDLISKDNERIRIYNSFNGSLALRIYLVSEEIQFNLVDNDRIIHRGEKARNASNKEFLTEIKDAIVNSIKNIKTLKTNLEKLEINLKSDLAEEIKNAISKDSIYHYNKTKDKDNKFEFVNYVDTVAEKAKENGNPLSVYKYINLSIKNFLDGNFGYKNIKTGNIKAGRKRASIFLKVKIYNNITKILEDKLPEYLI